MREMKDEETQTQKVAQTISAADGKREELAQVTFVKFKLSR